MNVLSFAMHLDFVTKALKMYDLKKQKKNDSTKNRIQCKCYDQTMKLNHPIEVIYKMLNAKNKYNVQMQQMNEKMSLFAI